MTLDSSTEGQDDISQDISSGSDVQNSSAASSPAGSQDGKEDKSLLDRFDAHSVVDRALKESASDASSTSKDPEQDKPEGEPGEDGDDEGEISDDPNKPLTAKSAKKLAKRVADAKREIETLKPMADSFQKVQQFCQSANLSREEVNHGFEIMAAMKADPFKALELLQPYVDQLLQLTGGVLPQDLQQKIAAGLIDEDTAREMAKMRAQTSVRDQQLQRANQSAESTRMESFVTNIEQAVNHWQRHWSQSDPDYNMLYPYVSKEIELALLRGQFPKDPSDAAQMCERIKAQVAKDLGRFRGSRVAVTPDPTSSRRDMAPPKPTSALDVVNQALAG